ncbi:18710_t:CDS:2 [Entrophospora sp. SA101]|nr:18710_t:CDS:2 [Entrophospora sp. SA101]
MPNDVMNAFKYVFMTEGGMTDDQATKYIALLEKNRRYQQEKKRSNELLDIDYSRNLREKLHQLLDETGESTPVS